MDRLDDVVKDCLDAALQLRSADPSSLPPPQQLHHRLAECVEQMLRQAADAGYSDQDARDLAFPVVALLDEVALSKGEAVRQRWQASPLQLQFFQETVAGESFFVRLGELRSDPSRQELLCVYYLCLCLGFEGKYRAGGGELELMTLADSLANEVTRTRRKSPNPLSAPARLPPESLGSGKPIRLVLWLAAATVTLALTLSLALWIVLKVSVGKAVDQISSATFLDDPSAKEP